MSVLLWSMPRMLRQSRAIERPRWTSLPMRRLRDGEDAQRVGERSRACAGVFRRSSSL